MRTKKSLRLSVPALVVLAFSIQACSLKDHTSHLIQIQIPGGNSSRLSRQASPTLLSTSGGSSIQNSVPVPLALSDFSCYAINVVGAGIATDPRLACPQINGSTNNGLGVIAGFVPAGAGTVTLSVPNGAARQVQLIGVKSVVGCPDLNTLLNNQGSNSFNGISSPYLLGTATTDIFADASVDITAAFNPLSPILMFQGCGGDGPSYPPTLGFTGYVSTSLFSSAPVPSEGLLNEPTPAATPSTNGSELSGSTALSAAQLTSIPISDNGTTPALTAGFSYSTSGGTFLQRAVTQLQWDTTSFDLIKYPYARVRMLMRGGQDDTCLDNMFYGATAAVYDVVDGEWIALNQQNYGSPTGGVQSRWFWVGTPIPVPVSKLLQTKADGKKYVVVNVDANYYSKNTTCKSTVYVAEAALQLLPTISGGHGSSGSIWIGSTSLMGTGPGGNNFVMYNSETGHFFANGGTPPYTFTATSGTVDSTGKYTAPAAGSTDALTVTDSTGAAQTATITLMASNVVAGLSLNNTGLPSGLPSNPITAGTCIGLQLSTVGFGETAPNVTGATNFSLNAQPGTSPTLYSSGCSTTVSATIAASTASYSFYIKPTVAGSVNLFASASGLPAMTGGLTLNVAAAAYNQIDLVGSGRINAGYCAPYSLQISDAYDNPTTVGTSQTVSSLPSGFYTDSNCSTAVGASVTIPASQQKVAVYFSGASSPSFAGTTTSGTVTTLQGVALTGPTVVSAGTPVKLKLSVNASTPTPDANGCIELDLASVDSWGNAQSVGGALVTVNLNGQTPNGNNTYTSAANCQSNTGPSTSAVIPASSSSTSFWIKTYPQTTFFQANAVAAPIVLSASPNLQVN